MTRDSTAIRMGTFAIITVLFARNRSLLDEERELAREILSSLPEAAELKTLEPLRGQLPPENGYGPPPNPDVHRERGAPTRGGAPAPPRRFAGRARPEAASAVAR